MIKEWLKAMLNVRKVTRKVTALDHMISGLSDQQHNSELHLQREIDRLEKFEIKFGEQLRRTQKALAESDQVNRRLEAALKASQEEVRTLENITIPGLVAAHQVLIHRWEAETQVLAMKSALTKGPLE